MNDKVGDIMNKKGRYTLLNRLVLSYTLEGLKPVTDIASQLP